MAMFARNIAPVSAEALGAIDEQAERTLRALLSARKFVTVEGPKGWDYSAVPLGRLRDIEKLEGIAVGVRNSLPLVESRAPFELDIFDLHDIDRGAKDVDLTAVERAAATAAAFEESVVYEGALKAGIKGMVGEAVNSAITLPTNNPEGFVSCVAEAVRMIQTHHSIEGPYALVGGLSIRKAMSHLVDGRPLAQLVKEGAGIAEHIYTPLRDETYVVSLRGGDLKLIIGQDYTVGYKETNEGKASFFLAASFTFQILEPRAFTPIVLK